MISPETRQRWADKIQVVNQAVDAGLISLNEWETEFMQSISEGKELSMKQSHALNTIYYKVG